MMLQGDDAAICGLLIFSNRFSNNSGPLRGPSSNHCSFKGNKSIYGWNDISLSLCGETRSASGLLFMKKIPSDFPTSICPDSRAETRVLTPGLTCDNPGRLYLGGKEIAALEAQPRIILAEISVGSC